MFLFHPWSFLLCRNLLDTREMNYWYASLGKEKQGKIRKREGTFVWSKLYKNQDIWFPRSCMQWRGIRLLVACAGYKTLIMGDSGNTSDFTAWQGHTSPPSTDPLWSGWSPGAGCRWITQLWQCSVWPPRPRHHRHSWRQCGSSRDQTHWISVLIPVFDLQRSPQGCCELNTVSKASVSISEDKTSPVICQAFRDCSPPSPFRESWEEQAFYVKLMRNTAAQQCKKTPRLVQSRSGKLSIEVPSNRCIPQNNTIVPSPGALGLDQWSRGINFSLLTPCPARILIYGSMSPIN